MNWNAGTGTQYDTKGQGQYQDNSNYIIYIFTVIICHLNILFLIPVHYNVFTIINDFTGKQIYEKYMKIFYTFTY